MNVCGCPLGSSRTASTSSSSASAFRFGPRKNSVSGSVRTPRTLPSSTSASSTSSGGCASPAGEAVPRLPPIVPRLRICGEPTVREASASAGRSSASSRLHRLRVGETGRRAGASRSRATSPSAPATSARLRIVSGRARSKFSSTSRSVPPAIGRASGRSALSLSASSSVRGVMTSTRTKIRYAAMKSLLADGARRHDGRRGDRAPGRLDPDRGRLRARGRAAEPSRRRTSASRSAARSSRPASSTPTTTSTRRSRAPGRSRRPSSSGSSSSTRRGRGSTPRRSTPRRGPGSPS